LIIHLCPTTRPAGYCNSPIFASIFAPLLLSQGLRRFSRFRCVFQGCSEHTSQPIDEEAVDALADTKYHGGMVVYGSNYNHLSDKVWEEHYMAEQTVNS